MAKEEQHVCQPTLCYVSTCVLCLQHVSRCAMYTAYGLACLFRDGSGGSVGEGARLLANRKPGSPGSQGHWSLVI